MTYKNLNDAIRKIANEHTKMVSGLKLPNTVLLQFRKDDSKLLSINTFNRLIGGLGLTADITLKDADGNTVSVEDLEAIVKERFGDVKKETLATIAGVNKEKKAEASMPSADEIKIEDSVSKTTEGSKPPEVVAAAEKAKKEEEADASEVPLAASTEVEVNLDDIFG